MTDTDVVKGEDAKLTKARWERLSDSIYLEWRRQGYDQYAHLRGVMVDGDGSVLNTFYVMERDDRSVRTLARQLAIYDMMELSRILRSQRGTPT